MRPASGDGEKGAWDLGGWMETTAVFPDTDERRFFRINARVDVESTLDSVSYLFPLFSGHISKN
jgi:hypothetical protein